MSEEIRFKNFTKKRVPVRFQVDDDVFDCVSGLSIFALQDIMKIWRGGDLSAALKEGNAEVITKMLAEIFRVFLDADSLSLFMKRLEDRKNPIDVPQLMEIIGWIIETYTNRPTTPSPDSSDGSPTADGGTGSPAGAQLED